MHKIKLPLLVFTNLLFFYSAATNVHAVNLTGEWLTSSGLQLEAEQTGNTFSLIVIDPDVPEKYQGIAELKGVINGNTFTGQSFIVAQGCPNLDGYKPASGTITNTRIEATTVLSTFDLETCTRDPGTEVETTGIYTKVLSPEEKALLDYQDRLKDDFANRSGPIIDSSTTTIISTSPVVQSSEKYPVNVGADTRPNPSTYIDYLDQLPNISVPDFGQEVARISNFAGNLTLHQSYKGQARDQTPYKTGTSIHHNTLYANDTFSFKGDGFIQYHGIDGSTKQFMTAGYAKEHGFGDQIKPGQAGLEIVLKSADTLPIPVPPPGPIRQFFNWLGELLTPEPQPTPYGIVGVKG